jgi:hypothetical protein
MNNIIKPKTQRDAFLESEIPGSLVPDLLVPDRLICFDWLPGARLLVASLGACVMVNITRLASQNGVINTTFPAVSYSTMVATLWHVF